MQFKLFIVTCVLHYGATEYYKVKPSFVKTCLKSDPDFEDCSREAVQQLFDALGPGLPEISLPPLDPLKIPKIRILQGDGPVNVNAALDDVLVTGFGKTHVLMSQVDGKTYDFHTKVRVPKIRIEGTYDLRGKILLIPLVGRGNCWFEPTPQLGVGWTCLSDAPGAGYLKGAEVEEDPENDGVMILMPPKTTGRNTHKVEKHEGIQRRPLPGSNMTIDIVSDVKLYDKDGFTFFNVTAAHVKYSIGGLKLRMNNLFDGIKSLEDSTNAYLNENWRPVSESLRPILSKTIEDILLGFIQQLFHNLPGNFMIGDIKNNAVTKKPDTTNKKA